MGRKKKLPENYFWCWYCNKEFMDEKTLIKHQKSKHFRCPWCSVKGWTGPGLAIHVYEVHKQSISTVPNALGFRNDIKIEIFGMEGIPAADIREHEKRQLEFRADLGGSKGNPSSKIIHPDEDLSLEEIKAQSFKYQTYLMMVKLKTAGKLPIPGVNPMMMWPGIIALTPEASLSPQVNSESNRSTIVPAGNPSAEITHPDTSLSLKELEKKLHSAHEKEARTTQTKVEYLSSKVSELETQNESLKKRIKHLEAILEQEI